MPEPRVLPAEPAWTEPVWIVSVLTKPIVRIFRNWNGLIRLWLEKSRIRDGLSSLLHSLWSDYKIHALENLTFQFTPVTHMVYLEIRLHYLDFAIEKLTSSNWISKYTMCVTGVNWKVKFLSTCIQFCFLAWMMVLTENT